MKWVDYSNKYGVGILLSDGQYGVLFNDNDKVMCSPDNTKTFSLITKHKYLNKDTKEDLRYDRVPDDLTEKMSLLKRFNKYLTDKDPNRSSSKQSRLNFEKQPVQGTVWIKKFKRSSQATLF